MSMMKGWLSMMANQALLHTDLNRIADSDGSRNKTLKIRSSGIQGRSNDLGFLPNSDDSVRNRDGEAVGESAEEARFLALYS